VTPVTARRRPLGAKSPNSMQMATKVHVSVTCPNQACQCSIPLGCLDKGGCCRAPDDWDRYELTCRRCGTRFQLVAENLSLWPVITNPAAPRPAAKADR
jgi:hypothetical protein